MDSRTSNAALNHPRSRRASRERKDRWQRLSQNNNGSPRYRLIPLRPWLLGTCRPGDLLEAGRSAAHTVDNRHRAARIGYRDHIN